MLRAGGFADKRLMAEEPPDDAYVIPEAAAEIPAEWQAAAVYTLELPARCPHCREPIRTLKVLRLARTQAAFTSTLPRSGRVLVCPACERIISAELSGLI
jgi:hypothetical protein